MHLPKTNVYLPPRTFVGHRRLWSAILGNCIVIGMLFVALSVILPAAGPSGKRPGEGHKASELTFMQGRVGWM